jgi:hypothetical protein
MAEDPNEPLFGAADAQADDDAREAYRQLERRARPEPSDFTWAHRLNPHRWEDPAPAAGDDPARRPRGRRFGVGVVAAVLVLGAVALGVRTMRALSDTGVGAVIGVLARGGPPAGLEPGDCWDLDVGERAVDGITPIRCDLPHDAEVVGAFDLDEQAAYPGAPAIRATGGAVCADEYARHVGAPLAADGPLVVHLLHPSEDTWRAGDRRVVCLVRDRHGGPLFGPAREVVGGTG